MMLRCSGGWPGLEDRISQLSDHFRWLNTAKNGGCQLCVLTRGETASLRKVFEVCVPEWSPLFEGGWIANTKQEFFTTRVAADGEGVLSPVQQNMCAQRRGMLAPVFTD